jgi:cellulose synthase/poly-beta-1,6-N-acetylglucosamine synthase-like glycosyltransferase
VGRSAWRTVSRPEKVEALPLLSQVSPHPDERKVLTRRQKYSLLVLVSAVAAGLLMARLSTLVSINAALIVFFTFANVFKLWLIRRSALNPCAVRVSARDVAALSDVDLPVFTVLVPLYREAEMIPQLVHGINNLDYPRRRLDVKILLEEDDDDTRRALSEHGVPAWIETITVPDQGPKGKSRACNVGLERARGKYLVIYDAEDRPEPDQLRKVVAAFAVAAPEVVCLQAKLNYFNREQNVLTRWFTAEYSAWFDQMLPGLQSIDVAVPLGGTSNHFIVDRLRALGGWNPYNVTEDADLGVRIFARGWRTNVIDSTTFEEANSLLGNWIRQRSRWVKGYMQTYLYQMRRPIRLYRTMGPRAFFAFHLFFGASSLCLLLNPVYLVVTALWFATHLPFIETLFPGALLYVCIIGFFAGNAAFTLATMSGCYIRGNYSDVKWALLASVYWLLMSVAAYKALYQLLTRPFYWEKTRHGLCPMPDDLTVALLGTGHAWTEARAPQEAAA